MKITLYRKELDFPLGTTDKIQHDGIRAMDNDDCLFENNAKFYGHSIEYSTDVTQCDMILFNLDRNYIYTNFNPVLFVDKDTWKKAKEYNVPVVFWHSGESTEFFYQPWFRFAQDYIDTNIWFVDSNLRSTDKCHLFFNNSNLINIRENFTTIDYEKLSPGYKFKFSSCTLRSEFHKHIIMHHLKTQYSSESWTKYTRASIDDINCLDDVKKIFPDFVINPVTPDTEMLSRLDIVNYMIQSCVIITINTFFTKSITGDLSFDPLYITDKFSQELSLNKPTIPVGHHGTVKYLQDLGFEFPNWINYSYDKEINENQRLKMILHEIDRIGKFENLHELSAEFSNKTKNRDTFLKMDFSNQFLNCVNTILQNQINK